MEFAKREPELTVLTDHALAPDESYLDNFSLRSRVGPVYDVLRHPDTRTPMAVAIYGDWGVGKTTAMKWLHGLLDEWNKEATSAGKIRIKPVWFYPWKYDDKEDVWRGLISEVIIHSIDFQTATVGTVTKAAKEFGLFLGRSFLHVLAGLKLKAGVGKIAEAELSLSAIKDVLAEWELAAHPEKAYLNEFEVSLKRWIEETLLEKERMVIFLDDLDRCMPTVALQVLEALKLYLNIKKLIFVVGVDRRVIDELVRGHYKELGLSEDKSVNYLAKMFQVEVELEPSEAQVDAFIDSQLNAIKYWQSDLDDEERSIFRNMIIKYAKRNPREAKRLLNSALIMGVGAVMRKETASG
ncbi:MAG: KAP family P-loop NTPase fold protein [Planctomycetota bacterium]